MVKESKKVKENKTETDVEVVEPVKKEKKENKEEGKVGLLLKEMRNKQGKSFEEISQELCIRKSYLVAIEESDYNNIPEYPYGIGFIRSYADYLGLNGNEIVRQYKEEAEADFRKKHPYFVMEPQVEATVPNRRYLLISIMAMAAIYLLWEGYNRFATTESTPVNTNTTVIDTEDTMVNYPLKVEDYSTNVNISEEDAEVSEANVTEDEEEQKAEKTETVIEKTETAEQITVTEASFKEPEKVSDIENKKENKEEIKEEKAEVAKVQKGSLTVDVLKETWIEVKNDKTLYISKVLQAGDSYTLPKANDLKLSVGKADGVKVMYNGKEVYKFSPNKKMNISVDEIIAGTAD